MHLNDKKFLREIKNLPKEGCDIQTRSRSLWKFEGSLYYPYIWKIRILYVQLKSKTYNSVLNTVMISGGSDFIAQ